LSHELGVAQHILRYWETRFPQLKPMQRAGNRRYYRPADVDLARRIHRLLNQEGYTVRGVQKVLRDKEAQPVEVAIAASEIARPAVSSADQPSGVEVFRLIALRDRLSSALDS
jgi:DNA-binding transcriptional MerR regulator